MKNILFFFVLCGCSATMVTMPTKSKYAPKGYVPKGVVKYLNQGMGSIVENRRQNAFEQMYEACNGEYVIIKEGESNGDEFVSASSDGGFVTSSKYWMIEFKCSK